MGRGCNVNLTDNYGLTPLHYAAKSNNKDIAEFLLSVGADAKSKDNNAWTPLHYASCYGHDNLAASLAIGNHGTVLYRKVHHVIVTLITITNIIFYLYLIIIIL